MTRELHPEWRDQYSATPYPFIDTATLVSVGGFRIPEGTFLDASFYPIGASAGLYLSRIEIDYETVRLTVGDENNDTLASGEFSLFAPSDIVSFTDSYGRPAGVIVSEDFRLAIFQSWTVGTHSFTREQTEFVSSCHVPAPEAGVRGFLLDDGSIVAGDIWLLAEDGIVLTPDVEEVRLPNCEGTQTREVIRVDVVGDPLFRRRLCEDIFATPNFVQSITFQRGTRKIVCYPDAQGDIKMTAGSQDATNPVLRIRPTPSGVVFEAVGETLQRIQRG